MLVPQAVCKNASRPAALLHAGERLALNENESGPVLPVDADLRGR